MESIIIITATILFVIHSLAALKFEDIAEMKGHSGYFGWCFLLGAIGWAMVIALPDRNQSASKHENDTEPEVHA